MSRPRAQGVLRLISGTSQFWFGVCLSRITGPQPVVVSCSGFEFVSLLWAYMGFYLFSTIHITAAGASIGSSSSSGLIGIAIVAASTGCQVIERLLNLGGNGRRCGQMITLRLKAIRVSNVGQRDGLSLGTGIRERTLDIKRLRSAHFLHLDAVARFVFVLQPEMSWELVVMGSCLHIAYLVRAIGIELRFLLNNGYVLSTSCPSTCCSCNACIRGRQITLAGIAGRRAVAIAWWCRRLGRRLGGRSIAWLGCWRLLRWPITIARCCSWWRSRLSRQISRSWTRTWIARWLIGHKAPAQAAEQAKHQCSCTRHLKHELMPQNHKHMGFLYGQAAAVGCS